MICAYPLSVKIVLRDGTREIVIYRPQHAHDRFKVHTEQTTPDILDTVLFTWADWYPRMIEEEFLCSH